MSICDTVCSHLDSDTNIAKNLIIVKENLSLLQEVHRVKGNVELTSLKRAKSINKWGLYLIQNKRDVMVSSTIDIDINIYVKMKVMDENHCETVLEMNQLEQLQNVLMLCKKFFLLSFSNFTKYKFDNEFFYKPRQDVNPKKKLLIQKLLKCSLNFTPR